MNASGPQIYHESVFFTGHVQGVGFRYTTLSIAREFEVSGYVANLADGRVQVEVEGSEREVKAFLREVEERMHGHIRKMERSNGLRIREFTGFTIH